jgi:hypothetical protein
VTGSREVLESFFITYLNSTDCYYYFYQRTSFGLILAKNRIGLFAWILGNFFSPSHLVTLLQRIKNYQAVKKNLNCCLFLCAYGTYVLECDFGVTLNLYDLMLCMKGAAAAAVVVKGNRSTLLPCGNANFQEKNGGQILARPGLPDGSFSNQKSKFG